MITEQEMNDNNFLNILKGTNKSVFVNKENTFGVGIINENEKTFVNIMRLDEGLTSENNQIEKVYKGECNTIEELLTILKEHD